MKDASTPFRSVLAFVLLGAVAAVCFSLGMWQLSRAAERDALHNAIEQGRMQAPMSLSPSASPRELTPWRAAMAEGRWSPQHTVLLENRNLNGRPGYWVATPLLLDPSPIPSGRNDAVSAGSAELGITDGNSGLSDFAGRGPVPGELNTAVLVLRGWLPRDMRADGVPPVIPEEPGRVQIRGELHAHVPRAFELWEWAGGISSDLPARLPLSGGGLTKVQNLDLDEYAQATGLSLLPVVLAQTEDSVPPGAESDTALLREWPGPSLDSDQNRGYALQWFSFSAIAAIAALFLLRNVLRRNRTRTR